MKLKLVASTLAAVSAACATLISLPAEAAGYAAGGYAYGGRPAGAYYGRAGGAYYGGRPWGGYYGRPYWGGGWGWRAGYGWGGYPGVGWGWAGYPGWGGYGYGWAVPPVVIQSQSIPYTYVEQTPAIVDAPTEPSLAPPPPPASSASSSGAWWYWCAPAQGYYPYVERCAEAWQRVVPQVPPGSR